jgi:hypothetical protein
MHKKIKFFVKPWSILLPQSKKRALSEKEVKYERQKIMRTNDLSVPQQKLLTLMKKVGYGRINNLAVEKGEPILSSDSSIERDLKLGANDEFPASGEDFVLKKKMTDFFEQLGEIKDGFIRKIEIRGGLPILMQTQEKITI